MTYSKILESKTPASQVFLIQVFNNEIYLSGILQSQIANFIKQAFNNASLAGIL